MHWSSWHRMRSFALRRLVAELCSMATPITVSMRRTPAIQALGVVEVGSFFFGFLLSFQTVSVTTSNLMWGLNMSRCLGDLLGHAECGMLGPQLERLDQPGEVFILEAFEDTGLVNQPLHRNVCAQGKESQLFDSKPDPDFLWDLGDELKLEMTNCFCFC